MGTNSEERPLRADAARNRARLLGSADAVFMERGADASIEDVAKHAKVGIGTLYRHFPTRESLLAAACDERLFALAAKSSASSNDDALHELTSYIEELAMAASLYRGLATSFGVVLQSDTPGCHAATDEGTRLLARAKQQRSIKRAVATEDITCVIIAVALSAAGDRHKTRRLVRLFIEGLAG